MSVKVISFSGPMLDYIHDDFPIGKEEQPAGHSGQLDANTVVYAMNADGTENIDVIIVPCPVDECVSYWPVGGGADARLGQMLHLRLAIETMSRVQALESLIARIEAMDGPDRYCLTDSDIQEVMSAGSS